MTPATRTQIARLEADIDALRPHLGAWRSVRDLAARAEQRSVAARAVQAMRDLELRIIHLERSP